MARLYFVVLLSLGTEFALAADASRVSLWRIRDWQDRGGLPAEIQHVRPGGRVVSERGKIVVETSVIGVLPRLFNAGSAGIVTVGTGAGLAAVGATPFSLGTPQSIPQMIANAASCAAGACAILVGARWVVPFVFGQDQFSVRMRFIPESGGARALEFDPGLGEANLRSQLLSDKPYRRQLDDGTGRIYEISSVSLRADPKGKIVAYRANLTPEGEPDLPAIPRPFSSLRALPASLCHQINSGITPH